MGLYRKRALLAQTRINALFLSQRNKQGKRPDHLREAKADGLEKEMRKKKRAVDPFCT
jgi:hypothetical protein